MTVNNRFLIVIRNLALILLVALSPTMATAVCAAGQIASPVLFAQAAISEGQAASIAKSRFGGKVLSVSKTGSGGRIYYKVKLLLDSGRVIIVTVDGQNGQVSGG